MGCMTALIARAVDVRREVLELCRATLHTPVAAFEVATLRAGDATHAVSADGVTSCNDRAAVGLDLDQSVVGADQISGATAATAPA